MKQEIDLHRLRLIIRGAKDFYDHDGAEIKSILEELGQENCHSYSSHTYQQPSFQPSYMPYAHLLQHTHYITELLLISIYKHHNIDINILLYRSIDILISICYNLITG